MIVRWRSLRPNTRTLAVIGMIMLLTLLGAAVFADVIAQHPPDKSSGAPYARPSSDHWLGTDDLGRDLWAQLVHGARLTLAVGIAAAASATLIGTTVALFAGWQGGWLDAVLMRIVDLTLSIPFLVLILVLASYFGRGAIVTTVLLVGVLWARPARLLRSQVLKIRQFGHVVAADVMGARQFRILVRHVLHRLVPLLLSQFVRAAAVAVIVQSGVAFLGLGDPDRVSWGTTLFFANNGSAVLTDAWLWWIVPPGVALTLLIVGLAFVGLTLEEIADPGVTSHGWRPGVRRELTNDEPDPAHAESAIEIRGFGIAYGDTTVLDGVDITARKGRVFGLVGESGSGKSSLALGVLGLLPTGGRVTRGAALLGDVDLRRLGRIGLSKLRGREIAIIPQAAMSLLDPTMTILSQVQESAELTTDRATAKDRAVDLLERVGIPQARHGAFPHELSGGQRQRVVIAMAVANQPALLVADEPTTGLDVITQHEILILLEDLRIELSLDILIISHDLHLIGAVADDIAIMYAGEIVESGATSDVLADPMHPYTRALVEAMPVLDGPQRIANPIPGHAPDPSEIIVGCAFAPRCSITEPQCSEERPGLTTGERWGVQMREVACHVMTRSEPVTSS